MLLIVMRRRRGAGPLEVGAVGVYQHSAPSWNGTWAASKAASSTSSSSSSSLSLSSSSSLSLAVVAAARSSALVRALGVQARGVVFFALTSTAFSLIVALSFTSASLFIFRSAAAAFAASLSATLAAACTTFIDSFIEWRGATLSVDPA